MASFLRPYHRPSPLLRGPTSSPFLPPFQVAVFPELGQRITSSQACGLEPGGLKRPLSTAEETRKRKSPFSQKTCVFCLQRGLSSSHALFFNIEPRKQHQMCSFLSEVHSEAGNSGLLWANRAGPRAGWARAPSPVCGRHPASRGLAIYQPGKPRGKLRCPLGAPSGGCGWRRVRQAASV